MKNKILCLCLSAVLLFTGLTVPALRVQADTGNITYELPVSTVNILADRNGYLCDRDKKVYFLGEDLSDEFRVVREDTREVVYTGIIGEPVYDAGNKLYVSEGDFTGLTEEGIYYIETDRIGRSYSFPIGNDVYEPLFAALLGREELFDYEENAQGICNMGFAMHSLMLALQCHGTLFEQDKKIVPQLLKAADWMLTQQDKSTGSVYGDYQATAVLCGALSMYTDVFGRYDEAASRDYIAAARKAWNWLEKQKVADAEEEGARFYAATQLFRADGSQRYHKAVLAFLEEEPQDLMESKFTFYGSIVYLGTERKTDRDTCTRLMQELVNETERICNVSRKNPYDIYTLDFSQNLHRILLISFVDYITPSDEYATVIENTIHYVMGRNPQGSRYLGEDGAWIDAEETAGHTQEWNCILLFALSDLLDEEDA